MVLLRFPYSKETKQRESGNGQDDEIKECLVKITDQQVNEDYNPTKLRIGKLILAGEDEPKPFQSIVSHQDEQMRDGPRQKQFVDVICAKLKQVYIPRDFDFTERCGMQKVLRMLGIRQDPDIVFHFGTNHGIKPRGKTLMLNSWEQLMNTNQDAAKLSFEADIYVSQSMDNECHRSKKVLIEEAISRYKDAEKIESSLNRKCKMIWCYNQLLYNESVMDKESKRPDMIGIAKDMIEGMTFSHKKPFYNTEFYDALVITAIANRREIDSEDTSTSEDDRILLLKKIQNGIMNNTSIADMKGSPLREMFRTFNLFKDTLSCEQERKVKNWDKCFHSNATQICYLDHVKLFREVTKHEYDFKQDTCENTEGNTEQKNSVLANKSQKPKMKLQNALQLFQYGHLCSKGAGSEKAVKRSESLMKGVLANTIAATDFKDNSLTLFSRTFGGNRLAEIALDGIKKSCNNHLSTLGLFHTDPHGDLDGLLTFLKEDVGDKQNEREDENIWWKLLDPCRVAIPDSMFKRKSVLPTCTPEYAITVRYGMTTDEKELYQRFNITKIPGGLIKDCQYCLIFTSQSRIDEFVRSFSSIFPTGHFVSGSSLSEMKLAKWAIQMRKPIISLKGTGFVPSIVNEFVQMSVTTPRDHLRMGIKNQQTSYELVEFMKGLAAKKRIDKSHALSDIEFETSLQDVMRSFDIPIYEIRLFHDPPSAKISPWNNEAGVFKDERDDEIEGLGHDSFEMNAESLYSIPGLEDRIDHFSNEVKVSMNGANKNNDKLNGTNDTNNNQRQTLEIKEVKSSDYNWEIRSKKKCLRLYKLLKRYDMSGKTHLGYVCFEYCVGSAIHDTADIAIGVVENFMKHSQKEIILDKKVENHTAPIISIGKTGHIVVSLNKKALRMLQVNSRDSVKYKPFEELFKQNYDDIGKVLMDQSSKEFNVQIDVINRALENATEHNMKATDLVLDPIYSPNRDDACKIHSTKKIVATIIPRTSTGNSEDITGAFVILEEETIRDTPLKHCAPMCKDVIYSANALLESDKVKTDFIPSSCYVIEVKTGTQDFNEIKANIADAIFSTSNIDSYEYGGHLMDINSIEAIHSLQTKLNTFAKQYKKKALYLHLIAQCSVLLTTIISTLIIGKQQFSPKVRGLLRILVIIFPIIATVSQSIIAFLRPRQKGENLKLAEKKLLAERYKFQARVGIYETNGTSDDIISDNKRREFISRCKKIHDDLMTTEMKDGTFQAFCRFKLKRSFSTNKNGTVGPVKIKSKEVSLRRRSTTIDISWKKRKRHEDLHSLVVLEGKDIEAQADTEDKGVNYNSLPDEEQLWLTQLQQLKALRTDIDDEQMQRNKENEFPIPLSMKRYRCDRLDMEYDKLRVLLPRLILSRNLLLIFGIAFTAFGAVFAYFNAEFIMPVLLYATAFLYSIENFYQHDATIPLLNETVAELYSLNVEAKHGFGIVEQELPSIKSKFIIDAETTILNYYTVKANNAISAADKEEAKMRQSENVASLLKSVNANRNDTMNAKAKEE